MIDPFEWQECGLSSHAIPLSPTHRLLPGDEVRALCGQSFTLVRDDFRRDHPNRTTCSDCIIARRSYQDAACASATRG